MTDHYRLRFSSFNIAKKLKIYEFYKTVIFVKIDVANVQSKFMTYDKNLVSLHLSKWNLSH